jgi:hypothetical protein
MVYNSLTKSTWWAPYIARFYGSQWLRTDRSTGSTRLGVVLPEDGSRVRFENVVFFKEVLDNGQI